MTSDCSQPKEGHVDAAHARGSSVSATRNSFSLPSARWNRRIRLAQRTPLGDESNVNGRPPSQPSAAVKTKVITVHRKTIPYRRALHVTVAS
jgi:hypothetical protein